MTGHLYFGVNLITMKHLAIISFIAFISCSKTVETEEQIGSVRFAGYDFAIIEHKTTLKKTGEITERYLDTLLLIDCSDCEDICDDLGDYQDYRR